MRSAVVFYGLMLALALGIALWRDDPILYLDAAAAHSGIDWGRDLALGAGAAAAVVSTSALLTWRFGWAQDLARALGTVLGPLSWRACLVLAGASGLAEEALFRGALQPLLGYVAASLVFGLVHFVPRREFAPWTVFSIAAGFLLGWLFLATGNLVAPVVAHFGINAINLRLLGARWSQ